jgi:5-methylcytosine-specific restriction endonuclease McrA
MPIKPENKHRYPKEWPQIRAEILERASHMCEKCKAPNRTRIARGADDDDGTYMLDTAEVFSAETGELLGQCRMSDYSVARMVNVVLTIAHLDHTPENCAPENLRAWCQRCHLRYDAEHHKGTAQETRRQRSGQADLFAAAG